MEQRVWGGYDWLMTMTGTSITCNMLSLLLFRAMSNIMFPRLIIMDSFGTRPEGGQTSLFEERQAAEHIMD